MACTLDGQVVLPAVFRAPRCVGPWGKIGSVTPSQCIRLRTGGNDDDVLS